jgi:ubiquinone/menaquinone biosynthesis C-methylase UbiE
MRVLSFVLVTTLASAQVAREANRDYETTEGRSKIVQRLESPDRLANLRPAELVARLDIKRGSTVVDLGTGTGNLLRDLSSAVGVKGRVIAEDIQQDFLDRARKRAAGLNNIEFVLGTETDPGLPSRAADLVIVVDAYHHFDYPDKMLAAIRRSLRPGGRVAIVEYHKKRGAMEVDPDFALTHIRAGSEEVVKELQAAGYKLLWLRDHAPDKQYIAMFQAH